MAIKVNSTTVIADDRSVYNTVNVGIRTNSITNGNLTGVGNSFKGLYISDGMILYDNTLNGDAYIGTAYNGLMAGPVNINGVLTIDGNFAVV